MGIFNEFFKKEKPFFTGITRGIGGFGFGGGAAGGGGVFSASGGTQTSYSSYRLFLYTAFNLNVPWNTSFPLI